MENTNPEGGRASMRLESTSMFQPRTASPVVEVGERTGKLG